MLRLKQPARFNQEEFLFFAKIAATMLNAEFGEFAIPGQSGFYIGDSNTNGSWRILISSDELVMQRRESGVWDSKLSIATDSTTIPAGNKLIFDGVGDTYIVYQNSRLEVWVNGTEVARVNPDGSLDVNGSVNANAF